MTLASMEGQYRGPDTSQGDLLHQEERARKRRRGSTFHCFSDVYTPMQVASHYLMRPCIRMRLITRYLVFLLSRK